MKPSMFIVICFFLLQNPLFSQVTGARLQASGLTCALCAKSIYTNLIALPFVDSVNTDLEASAFLIKFKPEKDVDPALLRKKVEDAGFFVSQLELEMMLRQKSLSNDVEVVSSGSTYQFVGVKTSVVDGKLKVQLIDKGFLSAKELKKIAPRAKEEQGQDFYSSVFRVRLVK
jgi:copper chaperone CopZ